MAAQLQDVLLLLVSWLGLAFQVLNSRLKIDSEQTLDRVQIAVCVVNHFLITLTILLLGHLQGLLEARQELTVTLIGILLLVLPALFVSLVEHWEHPAHRLHEIVRRKALTLVIKVVQQAFG